MFSIATLEGSFSDLKLVPRFRRQLLNLYLFDRISICMHLRFTSVQETSFVFRARYTKMPRTVI